jgi:hypothetical protein
MIEVFYLSNDKDSEECSALVNDTKWCTIPWEDVEMHEHIVEAYQLEALPQVIVLDKNLREVTREGADDLRRLDPKEVREYWISLLVDKLSEWQEEEEDKQD